MEIFFIGEGCIYPRPENVAEENFLRARQHSIDILIRGKRFDMHHERQTIYDKILSMFEDYMNGTESYHLPDELFELDN